MTLEKQEKSIQKIASDIVVANIVLGFFGLVLINVLIGYIFPQMDLFITRILMFLAFIGFTIFITKSVILIILQKSIIKKEKIFKLSFWVGLKSLFFIGITIFINFFFPGVANEETPLLIKDLLIAIIVAFIIAFIYSSTTYFWYKKLVK